MAGPENTADPKSQGAADGGDKTKLYAGKYKTPEEMEAAYKELERGYHETRQEVSQLRQTIETRIPEGGYGQGGQYVPAGVRPEADPNVASQVLTRFYTDPIGVLKEVKDTAAQEAEARISKRQADAEALKSRVSAWAAKNPDVAQYSDLLDFHVRQTDGRLAPETRLDQAAKVVRQRLVELRGKPGEGNPNPDEYIPGPSGQRTEGGGGPAPKQEPETGESALAAYAASRNTGRIKRPGTHH